MFTSDIKIRCGKTAAVYLAVAVLCAVFGAIYEMFSFGVFSFYMTFCFLPALVLGFLPFGLFYLAAIHAPGRLSYNLYNSGVAALTVGFVFKGVLEIYGTTNVRSEIYFAAAALFIAASAVSFVFERKKSKKRLNSEKNVL